MRLRPLFRVILYIVACLWVALFLWAMGRLRTHGLANRLAVDAQRLSAPKLAAAPGQVDFGHAAAGPLQALAGFAMRTDDAELCRSVRQGEEGFALAKPECLRALEEGGPALRALLQATRAEVLSPAPGYSVLEESNSSRLHGAGSGARYAAKLGALAIRRALASGDAAVAIENCTALEALAKDLSYGTGIAGRLTADEVTELVFPSCASAVTAPFASAEVQEQAARSLQAIADGRPPLGDTFRNWGTVRLLEAFGPFLGDRIPALPDPVRKLALRGETTGGFSLWETFLVKDYWHRAQARVDALVTASAEPPEKRFAQIAQLGHAQASFNPLARVSFPDEVLRLAEMDARAEDALRLLQEAAEVMALHKQKGSWPAGHSHLRLQDEHARLVDDAAPRGGLQISL